MQTSEESLKRLGLDVAAALVCRESTPRLPSEERGDCWNSQWAAQCPSTGLQRTGKIPILDAAKLQF